MEVVDQVLIVGECVNGLNVTALNTVCVIQNLQCRSDRVGGAGCCGEDLVLIGDDVVVHAEHDVLHVALTGSGQQNTRNAGAVQVLLKARNVAPAAGVVHQQSVLDAVLGVVDSGRVRGVDEANRNTVSDDGAVLLVHLNNALERAVNRVALQQGCTLDQVPVTVLTDHNSAQVQARTQRRGGTLQQNTSQQATNTTKAVQHNVLLLRLVTLVVHGGTQLLGQPHGQLGGASLVVCLVQSSNVNRARAQVQLNQGANQLEGVRGVQGRTVDVGYEIVQLQQLNDRLVDQAAAVNAQHHAVLAVQLTDEGDQLLCGSLTVNPGSGCSRHV